MGQHRNEARSAIDDLVRQFYGAFSNKGRPANVWVVRDLSVSEALVVQNAGPAPEVLSIEQFLRPRETLLRDGSLVDFEEVEYASKTDVYGGIAQRVSLYQKSGVRSGVAFQTKGVKTFQFVSTPTGWRISAVAWDDERVGFQVPDRLDAQ